MEEAINFSVSRFLVPKLRNRQGDGTAFKIANLDRVKITLMVNDEAISTTGPAMKCYDATLFVDRIEHDDRAARMSGLRGCTDQWRGFKRAGMEIGGKPATIGRGDKFVTNSKFIVDQKDCAANLACHSLQKFLHFAAGCQQ